MHAAPVRSVAALTPWTAPPLLWSALWASLAITAAAIAYYPILGHYFFADDFYNLYRIRNGPLLQYLLQPQGSHLLVTTYVIFYLTDLLFGANPLPYFVGVLALHLLNTMLLFAVIRRLSGSDLAACVGAALWGVCPTHEGSLGWYSVFGHVVLATSVLWLLYDLAGVERNGPPGWATRLRWVILILVGATSFGVGLATGLVFPLVAWLMMPPIRERRAVVVQFVVVALFIPVLYVFLRRLYEGPQIAVEIPFEIAVQNLVRQFGILLVTLTARLAARGIATTLVSTLHPTVRFPSPLADAAVALFLIGCVLTFSTGAIRTRRNLLAALLLMLASYAMIVAGRVKFYATDAGIFDATRYHYVASMAIALSVSLILSEAGRRVRIRPPWLAALVCLWLVAIVAARLGNGDPPDLTWRARFETDTVIRAIREAIEAAEPGEKVYIPANDFKAMGPFFKAHTLFPGWAGVFVIFFPENVVDGRMVYFLEPEYRAVRVAATGRRTAGLVSLKPPEPRDKQAKTP